MQILLIYLFLFIVGCILGWFIEVLFRRFFSAKRWVNPGFMKGPWLPLYGFGVIVMFTLSFVCVSFFPENMQFYNPLGGLFERDYISGPTINDLIPIFLMWIGMLLLEFFAGLIFIKGFKVKLWDYSNMRGNIMGILCPLFSFFWLVIAVLFYYGINPFLYRLSTYMHTYMFGGEGQVAHFGFIYVLGMGYGIFVYDFATSIGAFAAISKYAKELGIVERYEEMKEKWQDSIKNIEKKIPTPKIKIKKPDTSKFSNAVKKILFIDPDKEKDKSANYDASGRPIKDESDNK